MFEDSVLSHFVGKIGTKNWKKVSKEFNAVVLDSEFMGKYTAKTDRQCRERFVEVLDPNLDLL